MNAERIMNSKTMKTEATFRQLATPLLCLALSAAAGISVRFTAAQDAQDQRDIEAVEVLKGRRPSARPPTNRTERYRVRQPASGAQQPADRTQPKGKRQSAPQVVSHHFPVGTPPAGKSYLTLGLTLWRVREATPIEMRDGKTVTEKMMWQKQQHEVVVTRVPDESPVKSGDLIQMTLEYLPDADKRTNRVGYLYVINCEQMADGSWQNAKLIFPTRNTYRGENRLLSGQTVTLPDPNRPFVITRSNSAAAQQYETYLIIISPVPLDNELPEDIAAKAMSLSPQLARQWWQQWGEGEVGADLQSRLNRARTPRELAANGDTAQQRGTSDTDEDLTQSDAPPQTVFRKVVAPDGKMLVTIKLPYLEPAGTKLSPIQIR